MYTSVDFPVLSLRQYGGNFLRDFYFLSGGKSVYNHYDPSWMMGSGPFRVAPKRTLEVRVAIVARTFDYTSAIPAINSPALREPSGYGTLLSGAVEPPWAFLAESPPRDLLDLWAGQDPLASWPASPFPGNGEEGERR